MRYSIVAGNNSNQYSILIRKEDNCVSKLLHTAILLLLQLGLDCLEEGDASTIQLVPTSAAGALTTLFIAAVVGGAYASGLGAAYSRLYAWQSLSALAGLGAVAPFKAVLAEARACAWWAFDGPRWFQQVAWDIGLVTLHPAGDRLAVLAATDTD